MIRKKLISFIENKVSQSIFLLLISSYLVLLTMEGILDDARKEYLDLVYNSFFTFDCFLKIIGYGPKSILFKLTTPSILVYFKQRTNIYDFLVVLISYVQIVLTNTLEDFGYIRFLTAVKVFRMIRIFKYIEFTRFLMDVMKKTRSSFIYLLILFLLFNFVYALVGMQLFGGILDRLDDRYSKYNFDTFWIAFITAFNIITLDNWIDIIALGKNKT